MEVTILLIINEKIQSELEQTILAILSMNPKLLIQSELDTEMFYYPLHQTIYHGLKQSVNKDEINLIKLMSIIGDENLDYYLHLQDSYVSSASYESNIMMLEDSYCKRKANEYITELNKGDLELRNYISKLNHLLGEYLYTDSHEIDVQSLYELITSDSKQIQFNDFKYMSSSVGFIEQTLNIISARPSIGKSAFALNLMNDLSKSAQYKCIYINMEMTEKEIYERLVSMNSKIQIKSFSQSQTDSHIRATLLNTLEEIKKRNISIVNKPMSISSIEKLIIREKRKHENQNKHIILFIDYLGYIKSNERNMNDRERMGAIVRALQTMTKDYSCTIFLLAQINREGADNPTMQNLKDTGELEQSGHCILILNDMETGESTLNDTHRMKVFVAKNRSGKRGGNLYFYYNRMTQLFKEMKR